MHFSRKLVQLLFFSSLFRPSLRLDVLKRSTSIRSSVPLPGDEGIASVLLRMLLVAKLYLAVLLLLWKHVCI